MLYAHLTLSHGLHPISPAVDKNIQPLVPALQSNWLHIHVLAFFLPMLAISNFICLPGRVSLPGILLDEINYRSVIVGFPMLSAGVAVWAPLCLGLGSLRKHGHSSRGLVYAVSPCTTCEGWKGKKNCCSFDYWFLKCYFYLFWCKLYTFRIT